MVSDYDVKKLAAVVFLVIYLFSTNEVCQLMKLPVFFAHIKEHRTLTPGISFFDFLVIHYVKDSVDDIDRARDMQLPFKTADHFSTPLIIIFSPVPVYSLNISSTQLILTSLHTKNEACIRADFVDGIWQPPQRIS